MSTQHGTNEMKHDGLQIHWKNGIRSWFDIDGITIEVWASSWSGREEVRIDGALVSRLRSLTRCSRHRFHHAGHDYEVVIHCLAFGSGTFQITLYRDGVEADSDTGSAMGKDLLDADGRIIWQKAWKKMAPIFLISGLAGAVVGYTLARLVL